MSTERLDYPRLMREALNGVVRRVLTAVSAAGLPGDHHFFITFRTGEAGVEMPPELTAAYPDEMTIVLQHQFWNLEVDEVGFSVTLAFGGVQRRIGVPFRAIERFVDPSAGFGLQLDSAPVADAAAGPEGDTAPPPASAATDRRGGGETDNVVPFGRHRRE